MFKHLFTTGARFKYVIKSVMIIYLLVLSGCGEMTMPVNVEIITGSNDEGYEEPGDNSNNAESLVNSITLRWIAPEVDAQGVPLDDLGGYIIYYVKDDDLNTQIISMDVGNVTSAKIELPSPGIWCFEVTAYKDSGLESDFSNQACTEI
ncbi:MAG: fibronectin type III domain-containing protein [Nitrospiraceae bacterium]|nr:MAG: fibronectin type III domain-containing protein [Nitrospiraceae bacterium]